ncbi:MAG: hypothetical protein COB53_00530 [Elusimicrobia bacterium]|nr:MAG: hypothetical protein COB53_00530 [Elusimicrobiota bacterium]
MPISDELKGQIEEAFSYRGHVTVTFTDGKMLEGFLFNRIYKSEKIPDGDYIEMYPKDSEEQKRFSFDSLKSIELTGKDAAESYGDFIKRTGGRS